MLDVCEIFTSIQGEGPLMGRPAVFLRLAGCLPPFCERCDTPQALTPGRPMTAASVMAAVADAPPLVVITGGEPFCQWETGLADLSARLEASGRAIQFETSGKIGIPTDAPGMVVCSPKPMARPQFESATLRRADVFKFVIGAGAQGEKTLEIIKDMALPARKVWLMPEGRTRIEQLRGMPQVWAMCARTGYRFSPRLHILTFDDRQGV